MQALCTNCISSCCRDPADGAMDADGAGAAVQAAPLSAADLRDKLATWQGLRQQLKNLTAKPSSAHTYVQAIKDGEPLHTGRGGAATRHNMASCACCSVAMALTCKQLARRKGSSCCNMGRHILAIRPDWRRYLCASPFLQPSIHQAAGPASKAGFATPWTGFERQRWHSARAG